MRILFISRYFYPRLGGSEIVCWQILSRLAQRGHRIFVVTSKLDNCPDFEVAQGVEIYRPFDSGKSIAGGFRFSFKLFSYLGQFLKNNPVDIIINNAYSLAVPSAYFARKKKTPSITYVSFYYGRIWFKIANPLTAAFNYLVPVVTLLIAPGDIICCPSKIVSDQIRRYSRAKSVVIPSPIDVSEIQQVKASTVAADVRAKFGIGKGQRFLVFAGRLSPEKNICNLIQTLKSSKTDFQLLLVGEGPERSKIEALVKRLKMEDKVKLVGRQSHKDTLSIFKASDVLLLPSITEVFPTVVLEALSMEKPVISTRVGGVAEMASDNLYLIDDLREINQLLLDDIQPRPDPLTIQRYSLENIASLFENMCEQAREPVELRPQV